MKPVIVFGGSGTIGQAICRELIDCKRDYAAIVADLQECQSVPHDDYVRTDISDTTSLKCALMEMTRKHGQIYGIVNAAYPKGKDYGKNWREVDLFNFTLFMHQTVTVPLELVRAGIRLGCKNFVLLSSIYGEHNPQFWIYDGTKIPQTPLEYACAKAALNRMVRYLAKDLAAQEIRVNAVAPGGIESLNMDRPFKDNYCRVAPFTSAQETARAVRYLLGAHEVTGQVVTVDRGFTL